MTEPDHPLLHRLHEALASTTDSSWSLMLSGEAPWAKLSELFRGLYGDVQTGAGKKVESKFSYIGLGPTIAWVNACNDLFYPVMHDGIEGFPRLWRPVEAILGRQPYHLVSLGVGTGQKDRTLLKDLAARRPDLLYVPVDLSAEMLHVGTAETRRDRPRGYVLPIQLDFSQPDNLTELRALVHRLVGDDPVIYSLLGNTVANFDDDVELLGTIADILRPQDRLLMEAATTGSLDEEAAKRAYEEYANSEAYRVYAISALAQNTDLTTDTHSLTFGAEPEGDRALRIEAHYQNQTGANIRVTLPNRGLVDFRAGEGIRVTLSRKYSTTGLSTLLTAAGLAPLNEQAARPVPRRASARATFGLELLLLAAKQTEQAPSVADDIWRKTAARPAGGKAR